MHSLRSTVSLVTFGLGVLALAVFALVTGIPIASAAGRVTSSLMLPVDGLVYRPGGTLESVALTGRVHLVTQTTPTDPCQPTDPCHVYANLADVTGIGLSTGATYIAIGAVSLVCIPGDPCLPQFVIMPVRVPPDPIVPPNPILPITFTVTLGFDQTGHLLPGATTIGFPSCSVDFGCP